MNQTEIELVRNFEVVLQKIPSGVQLIAVSKKQPVEKILQLIRLGHLDFGENYVQEWKEKNKTLSDSSVRWHMIGPLQKNKIKYVVGKVEWIHSIDTLELLQEIEKFCQKSSVQQKVLLQVNIENEPSKSGFSVENILSVLSQSQTLKYVQIGGLMALPPLTDNEKKAKTAFRTVRILKESICDQSSYWKERLVHLSMGTSHDYIWAIEEGATMVRVGESLFGMRD